MLFHFAVKKGWLTQDPRLTYRLPKEELKEPNPFTSDELAAFFKWAWATKPHLAWMGAGMLALGLRPIELQHATWENVNGDERFLFIARSHPAKMPQACQNQPIPMSVWPLFQKRRRATGRIWTSEQGIECNRYVLDRSRRTVQDVFPGFQWKRFRKTYATMLEQDGSDVVVVSRLLRQSAGGKNVTMAQRHYIGRSHAWLRQVVDEGLAGVEGMVRG
jgi:integrase